MLLHVGWVGGVGGRAWLAEILLHSGDGADHCNAAEWQTFCCIRGGGDTIAMRLRSRNSAGRGGIAKILLQVAGGGRGERLVGRNPAVWGGLGGQTIAMRRVGRNCAAWGGGRGDGRLSWLW